MFDHCNSTRLRERKTPFLEDSHRVLCVSGPREKKVILSQTYLLVLECLLQRQAIPYCEGEDIRGGRGFHFLAKTWPHPTACRFWDALSLKKNRMATEPHPSSDKLLKVFLSMGLPTRVRPSFSHRQSLPSRSLPCNGVVRYFCEHLYNKRFKCQF